MYSLFPFLDHITTPDLSAVTMGWMATSRSQNNAWLISGDYGLDGYFSITWGRMTYQRWFPALCWRPSFPFLRRLRWRVLDRPSREPTRLFCSPTANMEQYSNNTSIWLDDGAFLIVHLVNQLVSFVHQLQTQCMKCKRWKSYISVFKSPISGANSTDFLGPLQYPMPIPLVNF